MSYRDIEVEQVGQVLVVRQDRAEKLNARTSQMYVELMAALNEASNDPGVAAVLLTGKGRFFSAGMDFNDDANLAYESLPSDGEVVQTIKANLPRRDPDNVRTWLPVLFIEAFIDFAKPLFAAVNGPAIGEGFSSLLHCDAVYASNSAYFWAPFARAGVAPEFCATYLMPQRLGVTLANAALYLGRKISVEQAKDTGFVLEVLPEGDGFESEVLQLIAQGLSLAGPPELRAKTLQSYKALLRNTVARDHLRQVCYDEYVLIRARAESGDTQATQEYYRQDLPTK